MTRAQTVGLCAAIMFSFAVGTSVSGGDTETVYRPVPIETTVTEQVPVPTTPDACVDLVAEAERILTSANRLDGVSTDVLDLISELRVAGASGDINTATNIENRLRSVTSTTVAASETIGTTTPRFEAAAAACQE